ncbi:MAG: hypothetical protein JSV74_00490 [Dehalococcoidia bacterium]|nr:MAG: hypothetical protein JSV74_00490 [Dehalococcoidia bacterium]
MLVINKRKTPLLSLIAILLFSTIVAGACGATETTTPTTTTIPTTTPATTTTTTPTSTTQTISTKPTLPTDLVTFSTDDFEGSGSCAICHSMLSDPSGNDVSISDQWRSTMMANASKDPFWQAMVIAEVTQHPKLLEVIEDTCATCHMPMARTQAVVNESPSVIFNDGFANPANENNTAAMDGVSCSLCHQVQNTNLGQADSFGGNYIIDTSTEPPDRLEFGPYPVPLVEPMQEEVGFTPTFGLHVNDSSLCAVCHTVYTPYLDGSGNVLGIFPEQTPYLEWQHSNFSTNVMCQTCHMPTAKGPVAISNDPSDLNERNPFYQHYFVGGNSLMIQLLRENIDNLALTATDSQFGATLARALDQLQNRSSRLTLDNIQTDNNTLELELVVSNITGHKFPTGFPSRRTWIHLSVTDAIGTIIFESGKPNEDGTISGNNADENTSSYEPHYDVISQADQVQIYESIMRNSDAQVTYNLLRGAQYAKDNRILPQGFEKSTAGEDIAVYGEASTDSDFTGGLDTITYQIDTQGFSGPFTIFAELLYHPVSYQFTQDLMHYDDFIIDEYLDLYQNIDSSPIQLATVNQKTSDMTTTPAATTTTEPTEAVMIPHDIAGREGLCLICHGEQVAEPLRFPDDHIGRAADDCLLCHKTQEDGVVTQTPTPTPTAILPTWGELASQGERAFISLCGACHGDDGSGGSEAPPNIGPNLKSFLSAQRLFNFISEFAPMDGPGSLSKLKYQQILAYMITESGLVQSEAAFDEDDLTNVKLQ